MKSIEVQIIEDNEGGILLITQDLKKKIYIYSDSVVRESGEAMNSLLKKGNYVTFSIPDLHLLDINLPKNNGQEVLKRIKADKELKHTLVFILSPPSSKKEIINFYKNSANCLISKFRNSEYFLGIISSVQELLTSSVQLPQNS